MACQGQILSLPPGTRRVQFLAAAAQGPVTAAFLTGTQPAVRVIPAWTGSLGAWDNRVFKGEVPDLTYSVDNELERVAPAILIEGRPAWWASHHHAKGRDQIYAYSYLFAFHLEIPAGAGTLTLPRDPRVKVFAVTASTLDNGGAAPLQPLFPELGRDAAFQLRFGKP